MPAHFQDGKDDGALRTIGEVSRALNIKSHVLRYWEQRFDALTPLKRSGGRRYYRAEDIALIQQIDQLINTQGYTIKGAQLMVAAGNGADTVNAGAIDADRTVAPPVKTSTEIAVGDDQGSEKLRPHLLRDLKAIRSRLAAALDA